MSGRKVYILVFVLTAAVVFYIKPDSSALYNFMTKPPRELVGLPPAEKLKPKNADLIAGFVSELVYRRRQVVAIDQAIVLKNLKKFEADNGSFKTVSVCDFLKFSEKNYTGASREEIKNDLQEILRIQSQYTIESRCAGTQDCDPIFDDLVRSNNAQDLIWIEPILRAKSAEDVLNISIDRDEILYFKALALGGSLVTQEMNSIVDQKKAISILQSLEDKYPENGIYPYLMISLKSKQKMSFQADLERFFNAKVWVGPSDRLIDFLYRQASLSPANYFSYLEKIDAGPKVSYYATHEVFKTLIPQMSDSQKRKFRKIAGYLYDLNLQNKNRLSGLGRGYSGIWLRRLHDPRATQLVDYFEIVKGTLSEQKLWDQFYDRLYDNGQCDEVGLTEAFKIERSWAEQ